MTLLKKLLWSSLFLVFVMTNAWAAADTFVIHSIQIQGAQGIGQDTVLDYLPVKVGDTLDPEKTSEIIRDLFQTGFFDNVSVGRLGNTLIVRVLPRAVIGSISVTGNSTITKDQVNTVLNNLGLVQGRVFDQGSLAKITSSLQSEYYNIGRYNAKVTATVTPETHNRVAVVVTVSEGRVALVEQIQIIGNHAFPSNVLINSMTLTTPKWNSLFTRNDQYSADKLNASLDALHSYYLDRGYLHFKIDNAQATLAPDRKSIYLIVHVTEGPVYYLQGYDVVGNLILPKQQLMAMAKMKQGDVFSRQEIIDANKAMTRALGNLGYAFADVNAIPTIDDVHRLVFITFHINPGNRVYVRRVNFVGNTKTSDDVLRRAMRIQEGGVVNIDSIDESTRQLNLLGYLSDVKEKTDAVPGSQDQVDIDYNVTEAPSAQATAGAGYGTDGFVINAGVNQTNFLGTGDTVGVNFNSDIYERSYSFNFVNPFYTQDGVSRGFNFYDTQTTPAALDLGEYSYNQYGFNVIYGIPVSEDDAYQIGYGLEHTTLHANGANSVLVNSFISDKGNEFNQFLLSLGWTRNGLDRAIFPTSGVNQAAALQISTPIEGTPLDYYKLTYQAHWYQPIVDGYILSAEGGFGYGNAYGNTKALPFFDNYYAGGIGFNGAVRGYDTNTLGPVDNLCQQSVTYLGTTYRTGYPAGVNGPGSKYSCPASFITSTGAPGQDPVPIGGNAMLAGSLGMIVPLPFAQDSLRTTVFVDGGNVFTTRSAYSIKSTGIQLGQLLYSAGVEVDWHVPVINALLTLSLAEPLSSDVPSYQKEPFQFNIGTSF